MAETQKDRIMRILKVSSAEADEILAYDKAIDRAGAKDRLDHDISLEAEKMVKKLYVNATEHKKPTVYKFNQRTRAENTTKSGIITALEQFLQAQGFENVSVENKERLINFTVGDTNFDLTLVQKRKPKS